MYGGLNAYRGGSGEPLVLLHGIGMSWHMWRPVLPLLERDFDVLALDLPGFGESPDFPAGVKPSVPALADGVERAMDDLGWEAPHIAGNSMGGWTALELGRRGRALTVTATSPAGMWSPRENAWAQALLKLTRIASEQLLPLFTRLNRFALFRTLMLPHVYGRPWRVPADEVSYAQRLFAEAPAFAAMRIWMEQHQPKGLEDVRCPVTVAWGTRDRLLLPRQGDRFVRHLPDAELRPLPGVGHVAGWDDPEAVAQAIRDTAARRS